MDIPAIALPPVIPDHELIRCIGRGSYGEVWLARTQMGRFRAVKVVYGERFGDDTRPFQRELEGLAKYEPISRSHPGLVAVLHFGRNESQGYFYYVMELGDDREGSTDINPSSYIPRTLATDSKMRGRRPARESIEIGIALTESLHELHRHKLVHRDIKPSNIIFVSGVPKLADVGLIAEVAEAKSYVGTEGFIAPEGPGSPQGDIYSLGKLLYEVSTGKDRIDFPTLPPDLAESGDSEFLELNEVLLKACSHDVRQRYQTARDMGSDLRLLQGGESVRRLRRLERLVARGKKWGLIGAVLVAAIFGVYLQVDYNKKKAAEIRQLQLGGHLADGANALANGDNVSAFSAFVTAALLEDADQIRSRTHRLRLRQVRDRCPKVLQMFFPEQLHLDHVEFSKAEDLVLTSTFYGQAQVWNAATEKAVSPPLGSHGLVHACFSPDGKHVLLAHQQGLVDVWSIATGTRIMSISAADKDLASARFNTAGSEIVTAGAEGAKIWDFPSGKLKHTITDHADPLTYAGFSWDGNYLVTAGTDRQAILYDARTLALLHRLPCKNWVYHADVSRDGRYVVTASFDRKARLWDVETGKQFYPEMSHDDGVFTARFSPDSRYIVTASLDGTVRLWDVNTREKIPDNPIIHHGDRVYDAWFSNDGRRLLVGCGDGTARIWELPSPATILATTTNFYAANGTPVDLTKLRSLVPDLNATTLSQFRGTYPDCFLTRNGRFASIIQRVATNAFQLQVCDLEGIELTSDPIALPQLDREPRACLAESARHVFVSGRKQGYLYDVRSGSSNLVQHQQLNIAGGVFSPDNKYLVVYGSSKAAFWELRNQKFAFAVELSKGKVRFADFSQDSRKLVICGTTEGTLEKCFAEIWDVEKRVRLALPFQHGDGVIMAAFSHDGGLLVTASEDYYAKVWNTATGQQLLPSLKHQHRVRYANFSRNGDWLATVSDDGKIFLWDATTRRPLAPPLTRLDERPATVRFVEDDTAVFITAESGSTWLWPLKTEDRAVQDLVEFAEVMYGRGNVEADRFLTTPQERLKEAWKKFRGPELP